MNKPEKNFIEFRTTVSTFPNPIMLLSPTGSTKPVCWFGSEGKELAYIDKEGCFHLSNPSDLPKSDPQKPYMLWIDGDVLKMSRGKESYAKIPTTPDSSSAQSKKQPEEKLVFNDMSGGFGRTCPNTLLHIAPDSDHADKKAISEDIKNVKTFKYALSEKVVLKLSEKDKLESGKSFTFDSISPDVYYKTPVEESKNKSIVEEKLMSKEVKQRLSKLFDNSPRMYGGREMYVDTYVSTYIPRRTKEEIEAFDKMHQIIDLPQKGISDLTASDTFDSILNSTPNKNGRSYSKEAFESALKSCSTETQPTDSKSLGVPGKTLNMLQSGYTWAPYVPILKPIVALDAEKGTSSKGLVSYGKKLLNEGSQYYGNATIGCGPKIEFGRHYTQKYYDTDCCPKRCMFCESRLLKSVTKDKIEGTVTELAIECEDCGKEVGYWAYGSYNPEYANLLSQVKGKPKLHTLEKLVSPLKSWKMPEKPESNNQNYQPVAHLGLDGWRLGWYDYKNDVWCDMDAWPFGHDSAVSAIDLKVLGFIVEA